MIRSAAEDDRSLIDIGVVVQARMGSRRLPGKALLNLCGVPLLRRLYNRLLTSIEPNRIVVATSTEPTDDPLADECRSWAAQLFRGSQSDVLGRLLGVADRYGFTAVLRVTGDNPLTDPIGLTGLIERFRETGADLVHNKHRKGYPFGTGAELLSVSALQKCAHEVSAQQREDGFIAWIKSNSDRFACERVFAPPDLVRPAYFLTIDFPEDVILFESIYREFNFDDGVPLGCVIAFLDHNPELAQINSRLRSGFSE